MVEVEVRGNGRRLTFEDRTKQRRHYKKDEEEGRGNDDDDTLQEFQLRWDLSPVRKLGHSCFLMCIGSFNIYHFNLFRGLVMDIA